MAGSETTLPRIVAAGIPAFLIVAGAVFSESRYRLNPSRTLVLLGDASYSIYLSHVIVLPVVAKLWLASGLDGGGLSGMVFVIVAMTASAFAGVVLYKLVERPLLQWLSGKKRGSIRQPAAARPEAGEAARQLSNAAILDYKPAPTARASRPGSNFSERLLS